MFLICKSKNDLLRKLQKPKPLLTSRLIIYHTVISPNSSYWTWDAGNLINTGIQS